MQTVTNYFIANLALADVVIGLFSIPFQFQVRTLAIILTLQFQVRYLALTLTLQFQVRTLALALTLQFQVTT
jgi:leucokinin receptor